MRTMTEQLASERQVNFIRDLMTQAGATRQEADEADFSSVTKSQASDMIVGLKQAIKNRPVVEPPEGIHYFDGVVYKVQVAQSSGRKYAKELSGDSWNYAGRGPLSNLSESTLMTLEDAQEYGKLYGVCARCGAVLTKEESIAAGIGPVCATRF